MITRLEYPFSFIFSIFFLNFGLLPLSNSLSAGLTYNEDVYQYKFTWGFLPVANLEIDFSEYESENLILSRGETTGLSRLLKNYSARVSLKIDPVRRFRLYELSGVDGGSREVRKIRFLHGQPPQLLEFKDTTATLGLEVEDTLDTDSVDPLSIFSWFFTKKAIESHCDKKFKVFDGKKRFLVKVQVIEDSNLLNRARDKIISCRITMLGLSVESSKEPGEHVAANFWPFNRKDQVIDVVIGEVESEAFYIREIQIHSPLGKIIGKLR